MASFLDKQLQKAIASGFKGKLLKGTITRTSGEAVDEYGDVIPGDSASFSFEGFVDGFSAYTRAQAGIPDTDAKVCIIAGSLKPFTYPKGGDRIVIQGRTFNAVKPWATDPAEALFEVQATEIKA